MTFTKRFNKFLKSEQCKMIGCIFLVLLASIMIKLSMPSTFEHLDSNIKFILKFREVEPSSFKISDFNFKISLDGTDTPADSVVDKSPDTSEVSFTIEKPSKDFNLEIIPKEGLLSKITSFKIGNTPYNPVGSSYKIPIQLAQVNKEIQITVT